MPRSRSSSPALKGMDRASSRRERLHRVRERSRSPDYAKRRRMSRGDSTDRNKKDTSPYRSRHR